MDCSFEVLAVAIQLVCGADFRSEISIHHTVVTHYATLQDYFRWDTTHSSHLLRKLTLGGN
jgi:hypothetical protein